MGETQQETVEHRGSVLLSSCFPVLIKKERKKAQRKGKRADRLLLFELQGIHQTNLTVLLYHPTVERRQDQEMVITRRAERFEDVYIMLVTSQPLRNGEPLGQ